VRIQLPRVRGSPKAKSSLRASPVRSGSETLLVVEDDPHVREVVVRTLKAAGYRVIEASSGSDGLAASQAEPGEIHLLVTDVVMPGLDGSTLSKRLCAQRPRVRTLFVSGYSNEAISHRGALGEGVELLRKPFTEAELLGKVRTVLDAGVESDRQPIPRS